MDIEKKILSDLTVFMKYARFRKDLNRRETWEEICERNANMHMEKFPELADTIADLYKDFVVPKKVLPAMRSLQFAGLPISINNSRLFNCAYEPIDHYAAFSEGMFLLLSGCGFGFSIQTHHVEKLPEIQKPTKNRRYLIGDSIEGWSDAIKVLVKAYFGKGAKPNFDFRDIRKKGARLVTSGGKAPGPEPLKRCLFEIEQIFESKSNGDKLKPIDCYSIVCHIADAVLAGGIRRSATIALFSFDDDEMVGAKSGNWWETNPHFARANNSAVVLLNRIQSDEFFSFWEKIKASGAGEPGIYFTNDPEYGTNPCVETSLRANTFCNLVEINGATVENQEDFNKRCEVASFINTLQASYTDFHYLRDVWKRNTEKDALIGVGITGIGAGALDGIDLTEGSNIVKATNKAISSLIGIRPAARCTVVKPAGTSSLVLGSSSGIHAYHNDFYIRRLRVSKNESIYTYLAIHHPELLEDELFRPHDTAVVSIPQAAPKNCHLRTESALDLLERTKKFNLDWVRIGHRTGPNYHNVSATISIKDNEWDAVGQWMWDNKDTYHGLSILPYSEHTYKQAPFEDITQDVYNELNQHLHSIDLTNVVEFEDNSDLKAEGACIGGACEII
jgi:ribonucleoside-triphosphate reductase (thioredoxin)